MLNIPTKITKGSVEITADVHLIKTGEKVRLGAGCPWGVGKLSPPLLLLLWRGFC